MTVNDAPIPPIVPPEDVAMAKQCSARDHLHGCPVPAYCHPMVCRHWKPANDGR